MVKHIVVFQASEDDRTKPLAIIDGKVCFPDRAGHQPAVGEVWEVSIFKHGTNGRTSFLTLHRQLDVFKWNWNSSPKSGLEPACLIVSPEGQVHLFQGASIEGAVHVLHYESFDSSYGIRTKFFCISPTGGSVRCWYQHEPNGTFWPERTWSEALKTLEDISNYVDPSSFKEVIRQFWQEDYARFEAEWAQSNEPDPTLEPEPVPELEPELISEFSPSEPVVTLPLDALLYLISNCQDIEGMIISLTLSDTKNMISLPLNDLQTLIRHCKNGGAIQALIPYLPQD